MFGKFIKHATKKRGYLADNNFFFYGIILSINRAINTWYNNYRFIIPNSNLKVRWRMNKILNENTERIKTINLSNNKFPIIITIPHSGVYLTKKMNDNLIDNIILPNMDWYLPELYMFLEEMNFTVIINNVSRYVIDPNRDINKENKNNDNYTKNYIYYKTTFGKEMYKIEPDSDEVKSRISEFYNPYHQLIEKAINDKLKHFDTVYLIDLHSFGKDISADIVLGNDNGKSTSNSFIQIVNCLLKTAGFKVKNNTPYSGGFITQYYGLKFPNCEALQIELWYQSYIAKKEFGEEEFPEINQKLFKEAQDKMKSFFEKLPEELLKIK